MFDVCSFGYICWSVSLKIFLPSFARIQKQTLMQHILRCDYEACRQYLVNLEQAVVLEQNLQMLQAFISHRCDGNRNILHACVSVCFPTSNKETKEEEGKTSTIAHLLWRTCTFYFMLYVLGRSDFVGGKDIYKG